MTVLLLSLFISLEIMNVVLPKWIRVKPMKVLIIVRLIMIAIIISMLLFRYSDYYFTFGIFLMIYSTFSIYYSYRYFVKKSFNTKRRFIKLIGLCLLWVLAFAPFMLFPKYKTLEPSGPYTVSNTQFWIMDSFEHDNVNSPRELFVDCFYSQENDAEKPIIIYSHGGISTPYSNESLLINLASHGYTACTLSHPYHTIRSLTSTGGKVSIDRTHFFALMHENVHKDINQSLDYYQEWMALRTHDLDLLIEDLMNKKQSNDSFLFLKDTNVNNRILIGHSLGGASAFCMQNKREDVYAIIALESPYLCDIDYVLDGNFIYKPIKLDVPSLHIYSDTMYTTMHKWPQYSRNLEFIEINDPIHMQLHIEGSGHFSLTDLGLMSPILTRLLNRHQTGMENEQVLEAINEAVLSFINGLD